MENVKERLLATVIQYMDESYALKSFAETLSVNDIDDIDAELEETINLWGNSDKVSDNIVKGIVKTYTKLAKKYTIDEASVQEFYRSMIELSFDKEGMNKIIEKERNKMDKNMKKIWTSQENGTMEKNRYVGKGAGKRMGFQEGSIEKETCKKYKKLYPKLAKELCQKGVEKVIVETGISEATKEILHNCGIEYSCPMQEKEEKTEEDIYYNDDDVDIVFRNEEVIIIDEEIEEQKEDEEIEEDEDIEDEDEEIEKIWEAENKPFSISTGELNEDFEEERDWISDEDKNGIFTEEEIQGIKRW